MAEEGLTIQAGQPIMGKFSDGTARFLATDTDGKIQTSAAVATVRGALTDRSSAITAGGTYQALFAASSTANHRSVQNPVNASELLSIKIGPTIYTLAPGGAIERNAVSFQPIDAWTITAATTGHAFAAAES